MDPITAALDALGRGEPVLVHDADDREDEIDLVYAAEHVDRHAIATLRNDAGGLICTAIHPDAAARLGFPLITDVLQGEMTEGEGDLSYDDRSAFSYWVNHADTETGVTDIDRALTARTLADAVNTVMDGDSFPAADRFRTPGHMAVLRAADDLLADRQGHTEMSVVLAQEAGCVPAATICEMLDAGTGDALRREEARAYADEHGLVLLDGETIHDRFG